MIDFIINIAYIIFLALALYRQMQICKRKGKLRFILNCVNIGYIILLILFYSSMLITGQDSVVFLPFVVIEVVIQCFLPI